MNRISVLLVGLMAVGCQEYQFEDPPESAQLPPLPPTVYPPDPEPEPEVPVAEAPVYAHTGTQLFEVEPSDGVRTLIGDFHNGSELDPFYDIAIDNDGVVVGGTRDKIYQVDPLTAQVQYLCPTSTEPLGMAFTPDNRLLIAGDRTITHLDLDTCQEQDVVYNAQYNTSGDIVGLPDGFIYWTVERFQPFDAEERDYSRDGLVRIDPNNWQVYDLGDIPVAQLYGIGYADGQLYGFSSNGVTVSITPELAPAGGFVETTTLRDDADISWYGATTNPVAW